MKSFLAAIFLVLFPAAGGAFTIEEAVERALANNHRIREAEQLERSAVAAAAGARSSFFPSLDLGYSYRNADQERFLLGSESSTFTVELSYNLFNGSADRHGLREARARAEAAAYQRRSVEADIALAVKRACVDLLRSFRTVKTAVEGVKLLEEQKKEAERFFEQGLIARNDLLRIEVELSSARQELLRSEGIRHLARRSLVRLMGEELREGEDLKPYEELPFIEEAPLSSLKDEMLRNRSEIRYLTSIQRALEEDREGRRAGYWPRLDLVLSRDYYGDTAIPDGQDGSFDRDAAATLNASWNLFNGRRTRSDVAEADSLARANAEALQDTEAELVLQLETALEGYRVARGNTETARIAVEQAEENYRVNESRFRQRLGTTTDLVDARFFLTRSRKEYTDALAEIYNSVANLERVLERPGSPTAPAGPVSRTPGGGGSTLRAP